MKREISTEFLPCKDFLVIKGYMSWREIAPGERDEWERKYGFPDKSLIERLKTKSGANEVYGLFCNSCRKDAQFDWVCGDDFACENVSNCQAGEGFEIVRLAPSEYCKIVCTYGDEMTGEKAAKEADEFFWNEWLKNSPYGSKIEGEYSNSPETADITLYDEESHRVIAWHPIIRNK